MKKNYPNDTKLKMCSVTKEARLLSWSLTHESDGEKNLTYVDRTKSYLTLIKCSNLDSKSRAEVWYLLREAPYCISRGLTCFPG
jgi:hypothetical protein